MMSMESTTLLRRSWQVAATPAYAAVLLQWKYGDRLQPFVAAGWQLLPDLFPAEFGLPSEGQLVNGSSCWGSCIVIEPVPR